jgi:autotransporter translocation and assembly factor TamB
VFASGTAILLLLVAAFLLFTDYPEQLRRALEEQLTRASGAPAVIRSIRLDLPRYRFELRGVTVSTPGSPTPILELGRVSGKLRVPELLGLHVVWEDLEFDGLTLHLSEDREGGLAVSGGSLVARPFSGLALAADRISVSNAVLVVANERVPWQLYASDLTVAVTRMGAVSYEGTLEYGAGRLRIKNHEEVQSSLDADFELHPSELLLRSAVISSALGEVDATGKLGFADGVRGRFALNANGDAARAAESLFGVRNASAWASGRASFRGTLAVEPENKVLQGTLLMPKGELSGIELADWNAEVFWDRSLLQVGYARGRFGGGAAKLQLHQPLPVAEHRAALEWEVDSASLGRILEGATGRPSPIDSLVSGRGGIALAVEAPEGGESPFELRGIAPEPASELTGVSFLAQGRWKPDGIELENVEFRTSFFSGALSGSYPRQGTARLSLDATTTDLAATGEIGRKLRRLVRGGESAEPPRFHLSGAAQVRGELTYGLPDFRFEGDLSSEDLRYGAVPLGDVKARVIASPDRLVLEDLVAGRAMGALAGRAALSPFHPIPERTLELDVTLSQWPIEELAEALEAPVALEGSMSGRARMAPGAGGLEGEAELELHDGSLAGIPFESGQTRITLDRTRIRIDPIALRRGNALVSGRIELETEHRRLGGAIETKRYPLDGLGPEWSALAGTVEGKIDLSGTLDEPRATLSARGRDIRVRGVELGEAFLSGGLRGESFALTVTVESEARELAFEAEVGFAPPYPTRGRARWHQIDTSAWAGLPSDTRAVSDGVAAFRMPLSGPDALERAEAEIDLRALSVESESLRLESRAPVEIRLRQGRLELRRAALTDGTTSLELGGGLDLRDGSLDVAVDGTVSFGVLETFYPGLGLTTTGETVVSARVAGTRENPAVTGFADFRGGTIRFSAFRQALADLDGRVVFDNKTIRLPGLRGVFGSGPVEITGTLGIEGVSPSTVDLSLKGSGVRLRYPEGFAATLDGELSLLGSANERMLSGDVVLNDATWTREYDLVSGILSDRSGLSLFDDLATSELFRDLRLDVDIRAPQSLRVQNSLATIEASAELELRGTVAEPVLLGRSEAQRGDLFFLGQRYNITTGRVDFVDPTRIEPFVDLTAETRVRSYRVELRLTGTPERVHPELNSDPPLRTVDILRLLAGANERDIFIGNEEEELAGVGVASLLTERLTQEVGKRAERLFGLDRFSINPFLVGQFANPTARVSLGKQITRELTVNYSTNLNATTEQLILIEYTPDGPMSWILSRDEEGDLGIDVKFRKSF